MRRLAIFVPLFSLALTASFHAHAFCRTTTADEPRPYDPSQQGCWTKGTPVAWHSREVGYSIVSAASSQISFVDATRVIAASFAKWSAASCSATDASKHPSIAVRDVGPVDSAANDCGLIQCDPTVHDPQHVVVFRDEKWPHNDPNNTLALTTVTYGVNTGEIFDADMEINTHDHLMSVATPTPGGSFDLGTIVTHEAGHFIGLSHSNDASAVMFVRYQAGRSELTADDQLGACTIYPPGDPATTKAGCACNTANGQSDAAGAVALLAVASLFARRVARRATSSLGKPSGT